VSELLCRLSTQFFRKSCPQTRSRSYSILQRDSAPRPSAQSFFVPFPNSRIWLPNEPAPRLALHATITLPFPGHPLPQSSFPPTPHTSHGLLSTPIATSPVLYHPASHTYALYHLLLLCGVFHPFPLSGYLTPRARLSHHPADFSTVPPPVAFLWGALKVFRPHVPDFSVASVVYHPPTSQPTPI